MATRLVSGCCLPATEHLAILALNKVFKEECEGKGRSTHVHQLGFPKNTAASDFPVSHCYDRQGYSGSSLASCRNGEL